MRVFTQNQQDEGWPEGVQEVIQRIAARVAQRLQVNPEAEVSITLLDNSAIRELNRQYRGIDAPTDVLSFALNEQVEGEPPAPSAGEELLGDVIISLETARSQAREYGHSLAREVGFLTAHGLLHLLGFDHQTPEEGDIMQAMQEEVLAQEGLER